MSAPPEETGARRTRGKSQPGHREFFRRRCRTWSVRPLGSAPARRSSPPPTAWLFAAWYTNVAAATHRKAGFEGLATADCVHLWNTRRIHSACGDIPAAEFEAAY